jgi:hypothetical protein
MILFVGFFQTLSCTTSYSEGCRFDGENMSLGGEVGISLAFWPVFWPIYVFTLSLTISSKQSVQLPLQLQLAFVAISALSFIDLNLIIFHHHGR